MNIEEQYYQDKIVPHERYKNRLVNETGLMYPNFTQRCIEWLLSLQSSIKNYSVYEYGTEISSEWWKSVANDYTGITANEHSAQIMGCNYHFDMDNYVNHITNEKKLYDLIIINGKWRDDCIVPALQRIKKGGYIIINNYHQERTDYRPSYWQLTTPLLEQHPVVIFHDEKSNTNNRTAIWQIVK